jgi:N-acetylmuramic acid 6-phosphate etherase
VISPERSTGLAGPPTEARNPRTATIDQLSTIEMLQLINAEDATVADAVAEALPALAIAVDLAVEALSAGCRLHYFGAGTSGRLAVLDAAELRPTYGLEPGRVIAHIAGGPNALVNAAEGAEDDESTGYATAAGVGRGDVTVGVSASGRTPFVGGALRAARAAGAHTVLVSANPDAPLAPSADIHVAVDTGPEVITGSTRMKAGTAAKLVLNALSTAVMVRMGRTYSNLMTDMVASNEKLRIRQVRIIEEATGRDADTCRAALARAGGESKVALLSLLTSVGVEDARAALRDADGVVHEALRRLRV